MTIRNVLLVVALFVLHGCDSTPGASPFEECLVTFVLQPAHIQVARGDSVLFSARRYGFCDQLRTSVDLRMQDALVATFRPVSDSSAVIRGVTAGSTLLTVIDRADTLHRAGVNIVVTP